MIEVVALTYYALDRRVRQHVGHRTFRVLEFYPIRYLVKFLLLPIREVIALIILETEVLGKELLHAALFVVFQQCPFAVEQSDLIINRLKKSGDFLLLWEFG